MLTPNLHHQLLSLNSFRFNCALTKGKSCMPILLNRFALVSTKAPDIDRWKYRSKCISSGSGSGPQGRSGRLLLDNGHQIVTTSLQWAPLTCNGHHYPAMGTFSVQWAPRTGLQCWNAGNCKKWVGTMQQRSDRGDKMHTGEKASDAKVPSSSLKSIKLKEKPPSARMLSSNHVSLYYR